MERRRHGLSFVRRTSNQGQIVILLAGFLIALVGVLGLAIDLGYTFAQKRSVQNAADAGAIAGARALTRWSTTNTSVTARPDVIDIVDRNRMGTTNTVTTTCVYVNDADSAVGDCSGTVPATATGVRVTVREEHDTYFMQAIPGAPNRLATSASATAHVAKVTGLGSDGPFIVCGAKAKLKSGGTMAILNKSGSTWVTNPAAFNQTFIIHGPQIEDCEIGSSSFKGLADQEYNQGKTAPDWFNGDTGVHAGPARTTVNGIEGCRQGTAAPYNCVMILPLAVDDPPGKKEGNRRLSYVVGYAPFRVRSCGANCHEAVLLANYQVAPPSGLGAWTPTGWKRGDGGVVTVRLTR